MSIYRVDSPSVLCPLRETIKDFVRTHTEGEPEIKSLAPLSISSPVCEAVNQCAHLANLPLFALIRALFSSTLSP